MKILEKKFRIKAFVMIIRKTYNVEKMIVDEQRHNFFLFVFDLFINLNFFDSLFIVLMNDFFLLFDLNFFDDNCLKLFCNFHVFSKYSYSFHFIKKWNCSFINCVFSIFSILYSFYDLTYSFDIMLFAVFEWVDFKDKTWNIECLDFMLFDNLNS